MSNEIADDDKPIGNMAEVAWRIHRSAAIYSALSLAVDDGCGSPKSLFGSVMRRTKGNVDPNMLKYVIKVLCEEKP